ncbi:IS1182 family transposase (plasmid) [Azospirillum brasilense]|uniref:IS1182 family transposase n=1 Tax=Azospirillum brasilense TaxID=192 RepID=A0A4D8R6W8_AZOBR|nr:IS1182 family transposase [Azospirillum brasilense]QCO17180.1 IS1182 family transposase [Azospirillum brasilense]
MSLRLSLATAVPEETAKVARAAFPRGCLLMDVRDSLGPVFDDTRFARLFSTRGRPAEVPWPLALVTLLQFAENLSDRDAADAVRARLDWKYLLALPLDDPGFDSTVLCEFRARLVDGHAEHELLDAVLAVAVARRLVRPRGRQRTDSTHVLAAVKMRSRIDAATEAFRQALNVLAVAAPAWLLGQTRPHWADRYSGHGDWGHAAKARAGRDGHVRELGEDGHHLLAAIWADEAPDWLRRLPAVEILRRIWVQQFYLCDDGIRWRGPGEGYAPSSRFISSPYDADARYGRKRTMTWVGYKAHLTEACDEGRPRIITHVQTETAPTADGEVTTPAHRALAAKGLLPAEHLVDTGYLDAALLIEATRDFGVDLVGPTRPDLQWQARRGTGFAAAAFQVDWDAQHVTCPRGAKSSGWTASTEFGWETVKVKFSQADCKPCPNRADCAGPTASRRVMTLRDRREFEALQAARKRERTPEFRAVHALRAGVEATLSQGVRSFGMRRARYIGLAKTRLQHVAIAAAMNLVRIGDWLAGVPIAPTRRSHFGQLVGLAGAT